jgi:hypothetical protein
MASRRLECADGPWRVALAAERSAVTAPWSLVLSFRSEQSGRSVWAPFPLQSQSQASLFAQAERISDADLIAVLSERLR